MKTFDDMPAANAMNDAPVTRAEFDALSAKVNDLAAKVDADESDDESGDEEQDSSIMGAMHAKPSPPAVKQAMKKPAFMGGMMKGKPPLK